MKIIKSKKAPEPIGPYSQAIAVKDLVFVSGMIALDPATGKMVSGGVKEQTERALASLKAVLKAAGHLGEERREDDGLHQGRLDVQGHERDLCEVLRQAQARQGDARDRVSPGRHPGRDRGGRQQIGARTGPLAAQAAEQPRCPCCGTQMVVVSETETRVSLTCPGCHVSDVRMKYPDLSRRASRRRARRPLRRRRRRSRWC